MATRVYFIRHGETIWSITGRHAGVTDLPLTEHGIAQARTLPQRLEGLSFSHVLISPLLRARQTCELAGLAAQGKVDTRLTEWNYGDYEGRADPEIHEERPDWSLWDDGCPGGESPAQVAHRMDELIAQLRTLEGDVALFAHAQVGSALAARWLGLPIRAGRHFPLKTGSISILGFGPEPAGDPQLQRWNDLPA